MHEPQRPQSSAEQPKHDNATRHDQSVGHNPNPKNNSHQPASTYLMPKKSAPNLWAYVLGLMAVLLVGLGLGHYWGSKQGKNSNNNHHQITTTNTDKTAASPTGTDKSAVLTVEVISPTSQAVNNNLLADGTVVGKSIANVSGRVSGVAIEKILVDEGDWVKAGQTLAVFDAKGLEQNVIEAQASVVEAQANHANAVANAERVVPLLDIDAVSQQEVDRYVSTAEQARALLVSAQARLNGAELTLRDSKVIAPVSGIISNKHAQIGSVPQQALFSIIEGGVLEWQAKVNPEQLKLIQIGMPVIVKTPSNDWINGKVTRISPKVADDRRMTVAATLENSRQIQAGMLLSGEFVMDSQPQTVVPVASVVSHDGYDYLMLVKDISDQDGSRTGTVERLKVELGKQIDKHVVVNSRLPNNALIIRQGGGFLNDGDKVRVVTDVNAAQAQATGQAQAQTHSKSMGVGN